MEVDNKTFVIVGLIGLGLVACYMGNKDLALAIGSGLVGYLSKDASIILNKNMDSQDDYDEEISGED